ncbi:hypothetical protein A2574_00250 [Candidatus Shapirobacteria bacterium RIFOXYD1_FULL_38_32]|uniref:Uncharacterized protein n=2 Tax=Candidatus Shapironibacteriota TaxID=1752721 RepID=A0A0G0JSH6_9BACT|nr:MAG: hypothetical protein US90_C0015G0025 [Candidatus Shapirobacteria bacterium GW2011_GWE2_38_30]KKQ90775.1 MAG: hypothetical protein UT14_C0029G0011 [Candidatus Shapirobacteria bacterium GW2011_GWE1_38_92]OGL56137.1 MAG: hypothetical protein A2195_02040 [Candidatus Shapirobacteria bacterium RIFOXYA1_FULL_39_17]OGL56168.1 MAG: hypothetical protein A2410_02965 [Candidatus Shapirobacteria bacterium RIFOXYC1_FULL_38_24]OGL58393.1 MAG: hypothetical protein A2574_00250 [Candidatus Shapirobacteri
MAKKNRIEIELPNTAYLPPSVGGEQGNLRPVDSLIVRGSEIHPVHTRYSGLKDIGIPLTPHQRQLIQKQTGV